MLTIKSSRKYFGYFIYLVAVVLTLYLVNILLDNFVLLQLIVPFHDIMVDGIMFPKRYVEVLSLGACDVILFRTRIFAVG